MAERLGDVGQGGQREEKSLYRALSMILTSDPDQRISEEITGNLYDALHLVNIVNKDRCILCKGFQDYKETPTPNILCMCTGTFMCVSVYGKVRDTSGVSPLLLFCLQQSLFIIFPWCTPN